MCYLTLPASRRFSLALSRFWKKRVLQTCTATNIREKADSFAALLWPGNACAKLILVTLTSTDRLHQLAGFRDKTTYISTVKDCMLASFSAAVTCRSHKGSRKLLQGLANDQRLA